MPPRLAQSGSCWQKGVMPVPIDPRALMTFGAVCREGSISAAARALNISQPSVSSTIANLEHRLGIILFQRRRSGIVLTAEGKALWHRAQAMDVLLGQAADEVEHARQGIAGPLSVGGTPGALVSLLPAAIEKIERVHGPFALNVVERSDGALIDMLRGGEIELAFVTTEIGRVPDDIAEQTLARDPFALIVGGHHADLPDQVSLKQVHALKWVLPEAQGAFRRQVDALFIGAEVPVPRDAIRCDSLLTTKAIVRDSDRVTILPMTVASADLFIGVLRAVTIEEAGFERNVGVRMLKDARLSAMAETLLGTLSHNP